MIGRKKNKKLDTESKRGNYSDRKTQTEKRGQKVREREGGREKEGGVRERVMTEIERERQ